MREILTILACALVALLTAALAGPYFVDWTAHRDIVEAQLGKSLGMKIATRGDIDLKLLPTPRLVLDGVETGDARGISLRSGQVRLELAIAPLMRGEFRFIEASFDEPDIKLAFGADGAVGLPRPATVLPEDVQFERIVLRKARLRIVDASAGAPLEMEGLDLEAEAASLLGPFKGAGSFARGAERVAFRFSTGAREADRLRLKFISDEAAGWPRADLDGAVIFAAAGSAHRVSFEGQANFSGRAFAGWRVTGPLKLAASGMSIDPLELKIGGDEVGLGLSGSGGVGFGAGAQAQFTLAARQFDVDRLLALQNAGASELIASPARWIADADFSARAGLPWSLALTTPAITFGGETLTDVAVDLQAAAGAPLAVRLEAAGPGRSKLLLDGKLETGPAAHFGGRVEAGARDLVRLADWMAQVAPELAARVRAIPFRALEAGGDIALSSAGFSARDLLLQADRSRMRGAAAFTRAIGADRARFFADMNSEALDLDALPDLTGPGAALADVDFALGLDARAVRVTRFGDGMIDAGRIRLRVARTGETLKLETFSLANIGGASFEASGEAARNTGRMTGRLDAQRLSELGALLQRVSPGPWAEALAARAVALSPARVTFSLDGARASASEAPRISSLRIEGTARGTRIDASIRPEANGRDSNGLLVLDSADGPQLVRQLGFEALPLPSAGRGRVTAELRGNFDTGMETTALAQIAGTQLSFHGTAGGAPQALDVKGQGRITSTDAAPFLRLMTFGLPDFSSALPVELGARIEIAKGRAQIASIAGAVAGARVSGDLSAAPEAAAAGRMRVQGALALDRLSLPVLGALVLGPPQAPRAGAHWAEARFGAGIADAPLVDIEMKAARLALLNGNEARDAGLKFSLAPGVMQLSDLTAKAGEAAIKGSIALRRDGATAALSGVLGVEGLQLRQPAISGLFNGRVEFSSTGQSEATLVAGLAGGGKVRIAGLEIPRVDAQAPGRVIAQADEGKIYVSENDFIGALRLELDKAALKAGDREFDATLAAGVLRMAEAGGISGSFDLRTYAHEVRAALTPAPLPKDWSGAAPQLAVTWKGSLAAPTRELDAGAYVNALSARAIARETARVEALEGDIRERAFFVRRQRGLAFLRLREREIGAWEVEQARLAAEAERRLIEEERRRAVEAARLERERMERERREAEARRREAEAARAIPPSRGPLQILPGVGTEAPAIGRN